MANNQNVNKVVYAGTTLIDLTGDDVTAGDVLSGKKFHLPSGAEATGTLQVVNRNLLDNWDFVGGGSQLGDGVFPINQRGQTTYNGNGYGLDRWRSTSSNLVLEILSGYISIDFKKTGSPLRQMCNSAIGLAGKAVTFSILAKGENIRTSITAYDGGSFTKHFVSKNFAGDANTFKIYSVTAVLENLLSTESLSAQIYSTTTESSPILCKAVKLELGSEQTLAHNEGTEENPVWVLNEVPDYGEELRKCQRYYQLFRTESLRPTYGEDCRPTMATEQPTKGTLTKGGVTYYTLLSES